MSQPLNKDILQVGILAVGTELTLGQIINSNAAWLSSRISAQGHSVSAHLTVPDHRQEIFAALQWLEPRSDLILVTGGLGPTSDDFTREIVAEWLGLTLEWDEGSWKFIQKRLGERHIPVQEIQRQQCYYPTGSFILENALGTAHGFRVQHPKSGKWLVCLPGPPRELQAIWTDHLENWLKTTFRPQDPWIVQHWDVLGQPESEIARRVELHLQDCPWEKAYRVHLPYVEFKLSYFKSQEDPKWLAKTDEAFAGLVVRKNLPEAPEDFLSAVRRWKSLTPEAGAIRIEDGYSMGYLAHRLRDFQDLLPHMALNYLAQPAHEVLQPPLESAQDLIFRAELKILSDSRQEAQASLTWRGQHFQERFSSIYSSALLRERERHYFIERSMMFWKEALLSLSK